MVRAPESSPSEGPYRECSERSRRDLSVSGRFPCANLEGYRVNVIVIFTRCGAPNTADYPPQYAIAAEYMPLHLAEDGPRAEKRRNGGVRRWKSSNRVRSNDYRYKDIG